MFWRDFQNTGQTVNLPCETSKQDGTRGTVSSGGIAIYRLGTATAISGSPATFNVDFYGTGCHDVAIDISNAGFATPGDFIGKWTAGTCDSVSLVGAIAFGFSVDMYGAAEDVLATALVPPTAPPDADCTLGQAAAWLLARDQNKQLVEDGLRTTYAADGTTPIAEEVLTPGASTFTKDGATAP